MKTTHHKIAHRAAWFAGLTLILAACGGGETAATGTTVAAPATTAAPTTAAPTTAAAPTTTAAPTTEAPATTTAPTTAAPTTTTTVLSLWEPYEDGSNDCQQNETYNAAPVCMPPDIETVEITRNSPLTVVFTFRAPPVANDYQVTIGFDLDNDAATGINQGIWADFHNIGPDLEFDYFADFDGAPFAQSTLIAPGPSFDTFETGTPEELEGGRWNWLDEMTLQLTVSEDLIPMSTAMFYVAGQTMTPDYHDPFPDMGVGPLSFP